MLEVKGTKLIDLNSSAIGLKSATNVCSLQGTLLVAKGTFLTEITIQRLKKHGISRIFICE